MADLSNPEVTMQDLGQLPLRANVAFAARCVRRILPYLQAAGKEAGNQPSLQTALNALENAEDFARGSAATEDDLSALAQKVYAIASEQLGDAQYVACAAGHAAMAAAHSARTEQVKVMKAVASAWGTYRVLLSFIYGPVARDYFTGDMILTLVRADFDTLMTLDLGDVAEGGRPVDPSEEGPLGPLWPENTPKWYQALTQG